MDTKTIDPISKKRCFLEQDYLDLIHLQPGTRINDRYTIQAFLGRGGFGTVFKVKDTALNTDVAIKFLSPSSTEDSRKFIRVQREIKISRKVNDRRLVKIYSLEQWHGIYYLVMEWIEGENLKTYMQPSGKLTWDEFRDIYLQILESIESLHNAGIFHRDLKPTNIFITPDGSVKILDFGLAKEFQDTEKTSSIAEIVGSPQYMSPEQIQGKPADSRSDIYQLGLILYRVLSGSHPFGDSQTLETLLFKQLSEPPPVLKKKGVRIPDAVQFILHQTLQKKPRQRIHTVQEIIKILKKDRISRWNKILSARWTLRFFYILLFLLVFSIGAWTTKNIFASRTIQRLDFSGNRLTAKNWIGKKTWEKEFHEYNILAVKRKNTQFITPNRRNAENKPAVLAYLFHTGPVLFSPEESVSSSRHDNRLVLLSERGEEIFNSSFVEYFELDTHDFSRATFIKESRKIDLDQDGSEESLIFLQHRAGMFPGALLVEKSNGYTSYLNPGSVDICFPVLTADKPAKLLILAHNNPMAHSMSIIEIQVSNHSYEPIVSLPNPAGKEGRHPDFHCIIPSSCIFDREKWAQEGWISFVGQGTHSRLTVRNDYTLTEYANGIKKIYRDDPEILQKAYQSLNRFYKEKYAFNTEKAMEILDPVLRMPVESPYLKSVLFYFKGDQEILKGNFTSGNQYLEQALELNPTSNDAVQRICEIPFLQGNPLAAEQTAFSTYPSHSNFWGLSRGKEIFSFYCNLHAGRFTKAERVLTDVVHNKPGDIPFFSAVLATFQGRYREAWKILNHQIDLTATCSTNQDIRFAAARCLLLSGLNPAKARFYFQDLNRYSRARRHQTLLSLAYLLALEKNGEAETLAHEGFDTIQRIARGDFETRLWLFYDAYLFGKIMKTLGHQKEANRGFHACIEANPHTELAGAARKELSGLEKKTGS